MKLFSTRINLMNKKIILFCFLTFFTLYTSNAQKVDVGEFEIEIIEAFNRNSVGSSFTFANKKFVGLEVLLIPKTKKNKGLNLADMQLKSENQDYKLIHKRGMTVHLFPGQIIHQRKPRKVSIFAEVDKNLSEATLYFNGNPIVSIQVESGNKIGTFKIL